MMETNPTIPQPEKLAATGTKNRLDRDYSAGALLAYTVPSILSLLFMSLYQMTDAVFISHFIGENALAAMNIVYPVVSVMLAVTLMLSTGGSAVVAKKMGEGKHREAKEDFTTIMLVAAAVAGLLSALAALWMEPLLGLLGATPALRADCVGYLGTLIPFLPAAALQIGFSSFFIAAGRPGLGLALTVLSGVCNVALDYVFIARLDMGIRGSALGTAAGYLIAAVPSLLYFLLQRRGSLCLVRPRVRAGMLGFTCFNGSSEMVGNLSVSVTTLLFNRLALRYMGETGVTAITVVLYAQFLLTAVFMGFISGAAPIFSFNFGSGNRPRLTKLFRHSLLTVLLLTAAVTAVSYALAAPIVSVFIRRSSEIFPLARRGFLLFASGYLFAGFNIYASGLFTALHNGRVSAILSVLRTFVFLVLSLLLLPEWIGADGIWLAVPAAELVSCLVSAGLIIRHRQRYGFSMRSVRREAR